MGALRSLALFACAASASAQPAPAPPPPLACLSEWYAVRPVLLPDGQWAASFEDGSSVPFDDRKAKTFEEALESPDIEDMFAMPYRSGPIQPVTKSNEDPGRVRFDGLFRATYGRSATEVQRQIIEVKILGQKLAVHRKVKAVFERVGARLAELVRADPSLRPYLQGLGGTFAWRSVVGTDRPSAHSYGISLDLNPKRSDYWEWQRSKEPVRWRSSIPQAIVGAFEAEGFIWGGRWYHYDTMHFEYRPELLDPRCRATPE
jgi:hypothetical protein